MIPSEILIMLIEFSERNEDLELVLSKKAPPEIVELAKKYNYPPFNKEDNSEILG